MFTEKKGSTVTVWTDQCNNFLIWVYGSFFADEEVNGSLSLRQIFFPFVLHRIHPWCISNEYSRGRYRRWGHRTKQVVNRSFFRSTKHPIYYISRIGIDSNRIDTNPGEQIFWTVGVGIVEHWVCRNDVSKSGPTLSSVPSAFRHVFVVVTSWFKSNDSVKTCWVLKV